MESLVMEHDVQQRVHDLIHLNQIVGMEIMMDEKDVIHVLWICDGHVDEGAEIEC